MIVRNKKLQKVIDKFYANERKKGEFENNTASALDRFQRLEEYIKKHYKK
jgi:hypothetical protein